MLSAKENYLEAVTYGNPDYVPLANEDIWLGIGFDDTFKMENWTDRFGVRWEMGLAGTVPFPKGNPLASIERQLEDYRFPDPNGLVFNARSKERLKTVDRSRVLLVGNITYFCFERAWALMGIENFLVGLIEYPDEIRYILREIAKYARGVFDRYLEIGVDAVSFSEDLGTQKALMMAPAHFREFFIPAYQYAFENVLKEKKMIHFHSCGCVDDIVGDLAGLGITVLDPVQARANNLHRMKRDAQGRIALSGGIDTHLILTGTPEDVFKEVVRVMEILKPGGGYVCGPDQSFPCFPEENIEMIWNTAREFGRY